MIRILRGPEPAALTEARRKHLARAILAWSRGATARDETRDGREKIAFDDYNVARDSLYLAQHRKCAYCDMPTGKTNQPVEHFRPKACALRGDPRDDAAPKTTDDDHYWWLAWTWENLFFACNACNGRGTKGNWFPIEPGALPVQAPPRQAVADLHALHRDVAGERRLLIDPSVEDPMDFIVWRPENEDAPWPWTELRWRPYGVDPGGRGAVTIATLGLDRDLPDLVSAYIRIHVRPKIEDLLRAYQRNDGAEAAHRWNGFEQILDPTQAHLSATYDAIEWFLAHPMMNGVCAFVGRTLPKPGAVGVDLPSQDPDDLPELRPLPDQIRLQVRAGWPNTAEVMVALCAYAPWTADTLAGLLNVGVPHVKNTCRQLMDEGRLGEGTPDGAGRRTFVAVGGGAKR